MHITHLSALLTATLFLIGSGPAQKPQLIKDINQKPVPRTSNKTFSSNLTKFITSGGRMFFAATDDTHGFELWSSDGTTAGTKLAADTWGVVANRNGSGRPDHMTFVGQKLFFSALISNSQGTGLLGSELCCLDLVTNKLTVIDILKGAGSSGPNWLTAYNGKLYFAATGNLNVAGNKITGIELWSSDGTVAGTKVVKDLVPFGHSFPTYLAVFKGELYLSMFESGAGQELWKTDGKNLQRVADINPGKVSSGPRYLTAAGDQLFLQARGQKGIELYVSDGTASGTRVIDVQAGPASSSPVPGTNKISAGANSFVTIGHRVFFVAGGNLNQANNAQSGIEVWVSDGTSKNTIALDTGNGALRSVPQDLTARGDMLFFSANDFKKGPELWCTDGTRAGTMLVKDIIPGGVGSGPAEITAVGARYVYFSASTIGKGRELWRSDGTAAGTVMVADIAAGGSNPKQLTVINGKLLFSADDGRHGAELYGLDLDAYAQPVEVACAVGGNIPRLSGTDPILGKTFRVTASGAPKGSRGILAIGVMARPVQLLENCHSVLSLTMPMIPLGFTPNAQGSFTMQFPVPNSAALKQVLQPLQAVFGPSNTGPMGLDWTNGLYLSPDSR